MSFPMKELLLFAYGNLMPGMRLWPTIAPTVLSRSPGSVIGRLHWHSSGNYPLYVPDPDGYPVHGFLLTMEPTPELARMLVTEQLLYGYGATWLPVHLDSGERVRALVFAWDHTMNLGNEILSGNYAAEVTLQGGL